MLRKQDRHPQGVSVRVSSAIRILYTLSLGVVLCWTALTYFQNIKLRQYVTVLEKNKVLWDKVLIAQYELDSELSKIISVGKTLPLMEASTVRITGLGRGGGK